MHCRFLDLGVYCYTYKSIYKNKLTNVSAYTYVLIATYCSVLKLLDVYFYTYIYSQYTNFSIESKTYIYTCAYDYSPILREFFTSHVQMRYTFPPRNTTTKPVYAYGQQAFSHAVGLAACMKRTAKIMIFACGQRNLMRDFCMRTLKPTACKKKKSRKK